ncbi:MAG: cation transporter [Bacteroidetes bacterium]|nr:MAG: cation transporter [Bacteroidota bacterium]
MKENSRGKKIVKASWVAIIGNTLLAILKILIGLFSGSLAVLADGIDSASDIITSLITLVTGKIIDREPNIKYPYGYSRADTIAAKFLSFVIFFAGSQLTINSVRRLFSADTDEIPTILAIYVTLFSIVGKFLLARYLMKRGNKLNSLMLIANGKNMQNDILISGSVLIGLGFTFFFKLPVLDVITALFVSLWIIKVSFDIFKKTNEELMDGYSDPKIYREIFKAISEVPEAINPHKVRLRKQGYMFVIEMDIEVKGSLSVEEGHDIAKKVEQKIKEQIKNIYDINIHIEPVGNVEEEKFGVSMNNLDEVGFKP